MRKYKKKEQGLVNAYQIKFHTLAIDPILPESLNSAFNQLQPTTRKKTM